MLERDSVMAYLPAWPRSAAARAALRTKKSGRPSRSPSSEQHQQVFFVGQHILAELRAEASPAARRLRRAAPWLSAGSPAPVADEIEMIALEHARLFVDKPKLLLVGLQGVDAGEQRLVQIGFAAMTRQDRRDLALDRLASRRWSRRRRD